MSRGTVKWFDEAKGFGFFQPDIDRRGKTAAENLKALD
ncbi:MAG: cold-shock protein [Reyranella sp.]|nr:cold shock domain-containing protein [Reyranella sp.]MBN9087570.1 cold-shock protein [Reyranella sp.]